MPKQDHTPPEAFRLRLVKCLLTLVWLAIIAVCLLHKDEFTLEGILSYTPAASFSRSNAMGSVRGKKPEHLFV